MYEYLLDVDDDVCCKLRNISQYLISMGFKTWLKMEYLKKKPVGYLGQIFRIPGHYR